MPNGVAMLGHYCELHAMQYTGVWIAHINWPLPTLPLRSQSLLPLCYRRLTSHTSRAKYYHVTCRDGNLATLLLTSGRLSPGQIATVNDDPCGEFARERRSHARGKTRGGGNGRKRRNRKNKPPERNRSHNEQASRPPTQPALPASTALSDDGGWPGALRPQRMALLEACHSE